MKRRDFFQLFAAAGMALVLPVISPTGEEVVKIGVNRIEIRKISGKVVVQANVPLSLIPAKKERIFNMVPGMEAVPIRACFSNEIQDIVCTIRVE